MNDALINRLLTYLTQPASASQNQLGPQLPPPPSAGPGSWRSRLPGSYIDHNGQLRMQQIDPNFRAFDIDNATADPMALPYGLQGYLPMPQWWAGPPRET